MHTRLLLLLLIVLSSDITSAQQLLWKFKTGNRVYSSAAIDSALMFIGSGDSNVYALNHQTGRLQWTFKTNGAVHSTPFVYRDVILVSSSDGSVHALNKLTGKSKWTFSPGKEKIYDLWDYYISSPIVNNNSVYWGSGDGYVYSINLANGKKQWAYKTGDVVHATPLLDSNRLYIGSFDGHLYCLNAQNGKLNWKFKTIGDTYFPKGEIQTSAALHNGAIYFGSRDYNIYSLNAINGTGHWNMKEKGSWIIATPLVHLENIYFGTSDSHRFYAMGIAAGEDRWHMKLNMRVFGSAAAKDSTIYFGCFNGKLYGVNAFNGQVNFVFQTDGSRHNYNNIFDNNDNFVEGFTTYGDNYIEAEKQLHTLGSILSTPLIHDNTIYFGSSDGNVYAVKLN